MVESFIETLISVGVGALLGFFSSIGFYIWRERVEKKELRTRLRQELEKVRDEMKKHIDKDSFIVKAFFRDYFMYTRQDLVRKVDATTWEIILRAYIDIECLRAIPSAKIKENWIRAMESVEEAMEKLN
ncbi:MAG: LapA family protein [archaeon]|nr:LapA family protein [archaeon]MCP8313715.1 LapA family protein [archaeon]